MPLGLAPLSADAKSPHGSSDLAEAGAGAAGVLRSRFPRPRRSTLAEDDPITDWAVGDTGDVRGVRLAAPGI